jgi:predicted dehydrogenase
MIRSPTGPKAAGVLLAWRETGEFMMRFALIGDSPVVTAVAQAVALAGEHQLVRWATSTMETQSPGFPARFRDSLTKSRLNHWEELLTNGDVDAVIVGESGDDWQPVVRQLLQAGKAVLLLPELVQSTAFFYELALLEAESPGRLFPLLDLRGHPLVAEAQQLVSEHHLGGIRHVQFERAITTTSAKGVNTAAGLMTHADLTSAILVDADLLRALFGTYDQVTASRSGDVNTGYSLATITLAGNGVPQVVWTAVGTDASPGWKVTLFGEAGTAVLESCDDGNVAEGRALRLTVSRAARAPAVTETTADSGAWLLEQFVAAQCDRISGTREGGRTRQGSGGITGEDSHSAEESESLPCFSLWDELACAVELVDAVERSIRRRRTIDVYFDTPSERGLFKTQMTAVGCSLLMLTLVAIVMYLVFEASIELPRIARQILVVLIFAPLGIFLGLQLLFFVARPATRDRE